jgi:hypothetical protein
MKKRRKRWFPIQKKKYNHIKRKDSRSLKVMPMGFLGKIVLFKEEMTCKVSLEELGKERSLSNNNLYTIL